ncbi:alpha/beta hydrolase-fold protein [Flavivirga amylovorans]|uniref:Alpha/beta hydrolase-fold protein n=1 Tax=Flavivirga amylovorans TaxID=870486 RepID=A0ABT8X611_9FLAO|nr:alpha/beta hydrolase-fold protein [Flavivirga amylovorans]MDO5988989.1 alpha/beta hydrolase-fold protein [Flavivirga amylovorans]
MIEKFKRYTLILFVLSISNYMMGQHENLYSEKSFISQSDTLQYRIMLPKDFDESKQYPVVLFLHGAGERGNNNKAQLVHGSKLFASEKNRVDFPAIVIFPQCPKNSFWASTKVDRTKKPIKFEFPLHAKPTKPMELVMQLMDSMLSKPYVNKHQLYVGGLSMGGMGTFEIIYRKPALFAAAFSICGAGNPEATKAYAKTTPLWIFHGANDDVVNPQSSVDMVTGILKNGGKPNFTLYAKDNHNSWDSAFAEPELLSWLFSNIKH